MIIQEKAPGEDSCMYDLQVYVGSDHKVRLMNFGNVLLEEHTPKGIGRNAATLVDYNEELMLKIRTFLKDIGYEGFTDCDLKYDHRDGTFKMFEINIRQEEAITESLAQGTTWRSKWWRIMCFISPRP